MPHTSRKRASLVERFWRYVEKGEANECWLWTGNTIPPHGYGQIQAGGRGSKNLRAHRASYELHFGAIPEGLVVRHSCDTPACVNPGHLSLGTQKQNVHDMIARGRRPNVTPLGERHGRARLSVEKVRQIRTSPLGCLNMARQLGVSKKAVLDVRNGRTWSHVT